MTDVFGGRTVGIVLCLLQWVDGTCLHIPAHSLGLLRILLPLQLSARRTGLGGHRQPHLKHHGMFLLEEPAANMGVQLVDISCFCQPAHIVPTNVWE